MLRTRQGASLRKPEVRALSWPQGSSGLKLLDTSHYKRVVVVFDLTEAGRHWLSLAAGITLQHMLTERSGH